MKRELAVLANHALEVAVPEDRTELEAGWRLMPEGCVAMYFDLEHHAPFRPLWVPVKIEGDTPLDVLWLSEGRIEALVTLQSGCIQGYGDSVIELPAGFCSERGIKVGDRFVRNAVEGLAC